MLAADWLEAAQALALIGSIVTFIAGLFVIGWACCIERPMCWLKWTVIIMLILGGESEIQVT